MELDLNTLSTDVLLNINSEVTSILEGRIEKETFKIWRYDPYSKKLYFNINNPKVIVEAVNKRNAKNILGCDINKVKCINGIIEDLYKGYDKIEFGFGKDK